MKIHKIELIPYDVKHEIIEPPIPAKQLMPPWFKALPADVNYFTMTAKMCVPMTDMFTTGYFLTIPCDIETGLHDDGERWFRWRDNIEKTWITQHQDFQVNGIPLPCEYGKEAFKFEGAWGIKMPKGYSALFIHPLTRFDLPFISMSAVVDSDLHFLPMNVPFFIKKDFVGVLKKGTPYSQVIPIKRSHFRSVKIKVGEYRLDLIKGKMFLVARRWYKENIWQKKRYE